MEAKSPQTEKTKTDGSDQGAAGLHGGDAAVADLDGDDLGSGGDAVLALVVGEIPGGDAGDVGSVRAW